MIETFLQPFRFALLIGVALLLGVPWEGRYFKGLRPFAFLLLNALLLATWFGGRWQGVAMALALAFLAFGLIRLSRDHRGIWMLTLLGLIGVMMLAKYDYPSWMPHPFRGGIWLRAIKSFLGIPDLKSTLGVSYLAFRLIHVLVEYRSGQIPKIKLLPFVNYVFFAPANLAGPINRYDTFERDFTNPQTLNSNTFADALKRIIFGLSKKILIAGLILPYTLGNLEPAGPYGGFLLIIGCLGYSIYIYADFSGYTDVAIGLGRMLGIRLPENFDHPYWSLDLQEFWSRWHMSLTGWIRTYVFYPLNLGLTRRHGAGARWFNPSLSVLVAFLIIGAWHGQELNYLVFGLLHGMGICAIMILRRHRPRPPGKMGGWSLWWRRLATFSFVSLSWVFFVYPLEDLPWLIKQALGNGS